jgi:serine/threonine protein kinase
VEELLHRRDRKQYEIEQGGKRQRVTAPIMCDSNTFKTIEATPLPSPTETCSHTPYRTIDTATSTAATRAFIGAITSGITTIGNDSPATTTFVPNPGVLVHGDKPQKYISGRGGVTMGRASGGGKKESNVNLNSRVITSSRSSTRKFALVQQEGVKTRRKSEYRIRAVGARGKQCQYLYCLKLARGPTACCVAHGGGKRCLIIYCTKSALYSTGFCTEHGANRCQELNCTTSTRGKTKYCIIHGGGKRCLKKNCTKGAIGSTNFCVVHGGGKRCEYLSCTKSAIKPTSLCKKHGGVGGNTSGNKTRNAKAIIEPKIPDNIAIIQPRIIGMDDLDGVSVLGKGSFGKVYLVKDKQEKKSYALKAMKKNNIIAKRQVRNTCSERDVMILMTGTPYFPQIMASFQTFDHLCLLSGYQAGGNLLFHLRKSIFTEERIVLYAAELASAFNTLHEEGLVYRDLKLENVLLDIEGHIILTDFGLVKENVGELSGAKTFCGTLPYLAPEIILCKRGIVKSYGTQIDWWALGTLCYEMFFRRTPFFHENTDTMFESILHGEVNFPQHLSHNFRSFLSYLLIANPEERLGCKNSGGFESIQRLDLFMQRFGEHWWVHENLKHFKPCFVPTKSKTNYDVSNFDHKYTSMDLQRSLFWGGDGNEPEVSRDGAGIRVGDKKGLFNEVELLKELEKKWEFNRNIPHPQNCK